MCLVQLGEALAIVSILVILEEEFRKNAKKKSALCVHSFSKRERELTISSRKGPIKGLLGWRALALVQKGRVGLSKGENENRGAEGEKKESKCVKVEERPAAFVVNGFDRKKEGYGARRMSGRKKVK